MAGKSRTARSAAARPARQPSITQWSRPFLAALAETSNVTASAKRAGITTSAAYEARRKHPEFNRQWQQALCEGYDNLEMELLRRLREGEIKPAAGAKKGVRTYENATALRLLAAHKDSAARQRSIRDNEDVVQIRLSINAKLEAMRAQALAEGKDVGALPGDDPA